MRATAVLACAALLAAGEAGAQAHKPPPPWQDPAGPPVDMDVWLKRLVGGYRFEGMIDAGAESTGIKGKGDCIAVGTGPGVQCILNVTWQDMYDEDFENGRVYELPGGVSYLDPAMLLFGLDTGKAAINYLQVDNKGLPEGRPGSNNSNRATFKTPCVNAPTLLAAMRPPGQSAWRTCDRIIRLEAKADARILYMWIDIEINEEPFTRMIFSLYRDQQVQLSAVPGEFLVPR